MTWQARPFTSGESFQFQEDKTTKAEHIVLTPDLLKLSTNRAWPAFTKFLCDVAATSPSGHERWSSKQDGPTRKTLKFDIILTFYTTLAPDSWRSQGHGRWSCAWSEQPRGTQIACIAELLEGVQAGIEVPGLFFFIIDPQILTIVGAHSADLSPRIDCDLVIRQTSKLICESNLRQLPVLQFIKSDNCLTIWFGSITGT